MSKSYLTKQLFVLIQFICIFVLVIFGTVFKLDWGLIAQLIALFIGIWAIQSVGQNNWSVYPVPNENSSISTRGIYKFVRHPMYLGVLLFCWPIALRDLETWSLMVALTLNITLIFKIVYEEHLLQHKHPSYNKTFASTKRLIPFIW